MTLRMQHTRAQERCPLTLLDADLLPCERCCAVREMLTQHLLAVRAAGDEFENSKDSNSGHMSSSMVVGEGKLRGQARDIVMSGGFSFGPTRRITVIGEAVRSSALAFFGWAKLVGGGTRNSGGSVWIKKKTSVAFTARTPHTPHGGPPPMPLPGHGRRGGGRR